MKFIAITTITLAVLNIANAQWRPDPNVTVIGSVSGQFFVSARGAISPHSFDLAAAPGMMTLQPALLAVSCERIKQTLLRELNNTDQWRGKIFVVLRPARSVDDAINVFPEKMGGNWNCQIELPDAVDRNRLVEGVVRACLLEIANRNATTRSAELPEWLVRGFTRQLMGSSEIKLILPPPHTVENGMNITRETVYYSDAPRAAGSLTRRMNPLAEAAEILRKNAPLTFDQLSWPTDEQLAGSGADVFDSSAQLLVSQLLRTPKGPACLCAMLAEMPDYLNWQLAFQDAFHETFEQPLDVEKWWALELTQFTDRDLLHLLTPEESWRQLDAVFQFPIDVRIGTAQPMRADISFQTIIRGWIRPRQLQTLKAKVWELGVLRLRIAPEYVPLVDQYRQVLQDYSKKRSASARILADLGVIPDKSVQEAIDRLNALDVQRANLRPQLQAPLASAAETVPTAAVP
jgi:hypothetical protein